MQSTISYIAERLSGLASLLALYSGDIVVKLYLASAFGVPGRGSEKSRVFIGF
jgi:hypothetical protein